MIKLILFIALFFYSKGWFAIALLVYFFYWLGDSDKKEITIGDLDDDMDCY